ncbi:hypothetical protein Taro_008212 [Colocasia esculenta]|uniref:F-actin-capping protein subunit beta n=1 Tax=Colocasia esculenta TaxID=4460 RepID=A0A843TT49_COLES|nr:hypothetical protein [Colocasia esculenta]
MCVQVLYDAECGKNFILCDYNRDANSYSKVKELTSIVCNIEDGSKTTHGQSGYLQEGAWDSIHVIEVKLEEDGIACYCLTSTVMLSITTESKSSAIFNLSGSIRRQDTD